MAFFNEAINILSILVIAIGAGIGVWGIINLLEGYGGDNPASKNQGIKQLMAGGGILLIGLKLVPMLSTLFTASSCTHEVIDVNVITAKVIYIGNQIPTATAKVIDIGARGISFARNMIA